MRRPLVWAVMATAAALVLVAGSLLGYALLGRVESIATIDVNPSVELRIGRKKKVTGVTALNADAQGLLDGMDLKGTDLNVAINALIGSMVRCGYISELKNSVLVSVEDSNAARGQKLQEEITADITQALEQSAIEAAVLKVRPWTWTRRCSRWRSNTPSPWARRRSLRKSWQRIPP